MQAPRRTVAAIIAGLFGLLLAAMAPAFACAPLTQVTTSAKQGQGGSTVRVAGTGFLSQTGDPIEIRWDSETSRPFAIVSGPAFLTTVAVPPDVGVHILIVSQRLRSTGALYARVSTTFEVTSASTPPSTTGYRLVASDGGIFAFGDARFYGSTGGTSLNRPIVGMAATLSGNGYWLVASDGGIFAFGDAPFLGSTGSIPLNKPVVGMAATPSGRGYWLVASDGGIFTFGDAVFGGSQGASSRAKPVLGMASTPTGNGYWLVDDGGAIAFGDARLFADPGLPGHWVGVAPAPAGDGYWLVGSDGAIRAFGSARSLGSTEGIALARPVVGMSPSSTGDGYHLVASDGGIFAFGDADFFGSTGGIHLNQPIVGMAAARPPAIACRNSRDPACGPFRWDPAPAPNQPLVASFTTAPTSGVVGQEVVFELTWSDGDAQLTIQKFEVRPGSFTHIDCFDAPPGFGAWTPPPAIPGGGTLRYATTFATAGTYRVAAILTSGSAFSPYGSCRDLEATIVVAP